MTTIRRVVDNHRFLLALDEMYRERMKRLESTELLRCARTVAKALSAKPANVPIEGYYAESRQLTEYFRLLRSLQGMGRRSLPKVERSRSFMRLQEVVESGLFGPSTASDHLLGVGEDPLYAALDTIDPDDWTVTRLTRAAQKAARASDDFSLPALAALAGNSVALAALRESVVLYSRKKATAGLRRPKIEYVWKVTPEVEERATSFVETFNRLFDEDLPEPSSKMARAYWSAFRGEERILGRCVNIAFDDRTSPVQRYHWAVHLRFATGKTYVYDFWEPEIWTTERYREECEYSA